MKRCRRRAAPQGTRAPFEFCNKLTMRIRSHLVLLALGIIIPVLAFALVLAWLLVRHEQAVFAEGAIARMRATMTAMDAQVEGHVTSLGAMGVSLSLDERNFRRFHDQMARVLGTQPGWYDVVLAGTDGRTIASASLPFPETSTLPRMLDPGMLERVVRGENAVIGGIGSVPVIDRRGVTIAAPVKRDGKVIFVLAAVVRPDSFTGLIQAQRLGEGWVSGLVDSDGRFIARIPPAKSEFASEGFRAAMARTSESWYRGPSVEGLDVYSAHIKSGYTNWSIGLGVPAAAVDAGATRVAWLMGGGVVGAIALALLFAVWLGNRISRPVVAIAEAARGIGRGDDPAMPGGWEPVSELREVGSALKEASTAVREREVLLEREKRALEEADRAKDAFIAMISHELRNPLAALVSAGELLEGPEPDRESTRHASSIINRQTRHMTRLVEDMLDISRLKMGKAHLQFEVLNLAEATATIVDTWRSGGRFADGRVVLDASPAWIRADRARIEQILSNLLDNALKFSPPTTRITVKVALEDGQALLQVADKGRGLPRKLLDDAFGLFVQGEQGLARQPGGMGIGLALVKRLTELQDGTVSVSSEEGQGAVFTARFPAVPPPPVASPAPRPAAEPSRRRVLLIEDNADFRSALAISLGRAGHHVFQAGDGETGLALLLETKPDVVLVDIGLPRMSGYEVARLMRAQSGNEAVLIALSGYGQAADRRKALAAGFDDHLTKPVAPERLLEVVQSRAPARQGLAS
jgi:signal transduction histidine kinase/CheY-like chemotaxis protein